MAKGNEIRGILVSRRLAKNRGARKTKAREPPREFRYDESSEHLFPRTCAHLLSLALAARTPQQPVLRDSILRRAAFIRSLAAERAVVELVGGYAPRKWRRERLYNRKHAQTRD